MTWTPPPIPTELVARLFLILRNLRDGLALRGAKEHATGPLVVLICKRLSYLYARVEKLVTAAREGRLPAPRARREREPLPEQADGTQQEKAEDGAGLRRSRQKDKTEKKLRLPRGFGWMLRLAPEVRQTWGQVHFWMNDPELPELVAKAPQLGRLLRWLCYAMHIEPPAALRPPPRQRRKAEEPAGGAVTPDPISARAAKVARRRKADRPSKAEIRSWMPGQKRPLSFGGGARTDPPPGCFKKA